MGLPGAGKSSLARGIQSSFRGTAAVVIVELDDFLTHRAQPAARTCEAGELIFDPDEWHLAWEMFTTHISLLLCGNAPESQGVTVVLAVDTFHFSSMRLALWRLVRDANTARQKAAVPLHSFGQIFLDTPLDVALRRNNCRTASSKIPDPVVHRMAAVMDGCSDEHKSRLVARLGGAPLRVYHDREAIDFAWIVDWIFALSLEGRRQPLHKSELASDAGNSEQIGGAMQSQSHRVDLALRGVTARAIAGALPEHKRVVAASCIVEKKNFLRHFKCERQQVSAINSNGERLDADEEAEMIDSCVAEFEQLVNRFAHQPGSTI